MRGKIIQFPYALATRNPALAEIGDIWYWDPSIGYYNPELSEPPTISIGSEAGAQFIVYNLSDEYLDLGLYINAWDPLGNGVGASIGGPVSVPPGGSFGHHLRVVTEFPGTYTFDVDIITSPLYPYGIIGTLKNVPVAHVVGEIPPLAGRVYEPYVIDTTTGETFYSLALPVEIDGGHGVVVGIHWINEGGEAAILTAAFELVDPDGISREQQAFDTVLSPGEATGGQTGRSVRLDKVGMWKIHAILESSGVLLDEQTWDAVATVAPPPEYFGTIIKRELEYDESRGEIPVPSVPISTGGKIHVWGRNDTATPQKMGIHWVVTDPDGITMPDYSDWQLGSESPGDTHEFISPGRFDLDKKGTYTLAVSLFMNEASPVMVDSYQGGLCTVTLEVPPEYELLEETIYPYAYIYDGDDETVIFTFKTDPFTPADWIAGRLASHVEAEVRKNGGRVMEMRVYVDKTPLFWSDWRIEVRGVPSAGVAASVGIVWWGAAILAALAIALIIAITWGVKNIASVFKRNPALVDVKPGWDKETLILTIHDSEEYWERPLTPAETLEGMSEGELRGYLDQIAEEEVPTGVSWLPWVAVGAVAVVGMGTAIALRGRKK